MTTPLYPRVTEILRSVGLDPDYSMVPAAALEVARARGIAVHSALEALTYGYLDGETPEIAPYLSAARKFISESGYKPQVAEVRVVNETWKYQGHIDSVGTMPLKGSVVRALCDWKTAESLDVEYAGYQLAGYRLAWQASHPATPIHVVAAVQLRSDGSYRFHEIDPAHAEPVWLAAVTVFHARRRRP